MEQKLNVSNRDRLKNYPWHIKRFTDRPNTVGQIALTDDEWEILEWNTLFDLVSVIPECNRISCSNQTFTQRTIMRNDMDELLEWFEDQQHIVIADIFKIQMNDGVIKYMVKYINTIEKE